VLTGKFRFRTHRKWFGEDLLVLQLEWVCGPGELITRGLPRSGWRDATLFDLQRSTFRRVAQDIANLVAEERPQPPADGERQP